MELFVWPWMFLVIPLPWVAAHFLPAVQSENKTAVMALKVPFFERVYSLRQVYNAPMSRWSLFWMTCAWVFFVLAAARPVLYDETALPPLKVRNILIAVDASGSMAERDFAIQGRSVTRLGTVKAVLDEFIEKRAGDNIGLVVFGSEAYPYTPLTLDTKTLRALLDEIDIGIAGEMTALGDALALSVQQTLNIPADSRIVILLSDGFANAGVVSTAQALELAQKHQVKVYTVGIGAAPFQEQGFWGTRLVDPAADLDEAALQKIADATGGLYFRARTSDDLQEIYHQIDRLEEQEVTESRLKPRRDIFYWPLLVGLVCLFISLISREKFA